MDIKLSPKVYFTSLNKVLVEIENLEKDLSVLQSFLDQFQNHQTLSVNYLANDEVYARNIEKLYRIMEILYEKK